VRPEKKRKASRQGDSVRARCLLKKAIRREGWGTGRGVYWGDTKHRIDQNWAKGTEKEEPFKSPDL